MLNQSKAVLARAAITATPVTATLAAPASVAANGKVEVSWTGPGYRGDYVALAQAGSRDDGYETYADVRAGEATLRVRTPAAPGDYELRYVLGQSRAVLARRKVAIAAP